MTKKTDTLEFWALMPRELIVWALALLSVCLWSLTGHGRASAAGDVVQIAAPAGQGNEPPVERRRFKFQLNIKMRSNTNSPHR